MHATTTKPDDADDRHRGDGVRIAGRADDPRRAAEDEQDEERAADADRAHHDVQHSENFDVRLHVVSPYFSNGTTVNDCGDPIGVTSVPTILPSTA